jgi:hypothetical protein
MFDSPIVDYDFAPFDFLAPLRETELSPDVSRKGAKKNKSRTEKLSGIPTEVI